MKSELANFASRRARAAARRVAVPLILALAFLFFLGMAIAAGFVALFFSLEPSFGPREAALILAGLALALGFVALIPLLIPRRRRAPENDLTLSALAALAVKALPALKPRQLALAGVLVALGLALTSTSAKGEKK